MNPNAQSETGETPFVLAMTEYHISTAVTFLKVPGIVVTGRHHYYDNATPLHSAAKVNAIEAMERILAISVEDLNAQSDMKATPLIIALMNRSFECVDKLLSMENVNVNMADHMKVVLFFIELLFITLCLSSVRILSDVCWIWELILCSKKFMSSRHTSMPCAHTMTKEKRFSNHTIHHQKKILSRKKSHQRMNKESH